MRRESPETVEAIRRVTGDSRGEEVKPVKERVLQYMRVHQMTSPGETVILAVSGGPDSVVLLSLLHDLAPTLKINLHIFHMDHGLRGDESAEDARYVRRLAERFGIPASFVGLGPDFLRLQGGSLQAAARSARHRELANLAQRLGTNKVALGHHRDDQAETVLMRFVRGTGPGGLSGIHPVRTVNGLSLIRPLLCLTRADIEQFCADAELLPRLDPSNLKPAYVRNRIRLELVPYLQRQYNPGLPQSLAQLAEIVREEDLYLDNLATQALDRCRIPGGTLTLDGAVLTRESLAIARRVVRQASKDVAGIDLHLDAVDAILEAARSREGTVNVQLPGTLWVSVEYGRCRFYLEEPMARHDQEAEWPVSLSGATHIPELGLSISIEASRPPVGPYESVLDLDRIPGPLAIRLRRPGDRIWPQGMDGSKKLQDILVDAKVPRRQRDQVPLLVAGDEILWVIGYRLDRRFMADALTKNRLFLRVSGVDASA